MDLKTKWHYRQAILAWLSQFFSLTIALAVLVLIRFYKFTQYGLAMYPNVRWPKNVEVTQALQVFMELSVDPLIYWFLVAILVDILILRPLVHRLIR